MKIHCPPPDDRGVPKLKRANLESVLIVPHIPGRELRKVLQEVDSEVMGRQKFDRVKVVEMMGDSLISALGNKAPWRNEPCSRNACTTCTTKTIICSSRN